MNRALTRASSLALVATLGLSLGIDRLHGASTPAELDASALANLPACFSALPQAYLEELSESTSNTHSNRQSDQTALDARAIPPTLQQARDHLYRPAEAARTAYPPSSRIHPSRGVTEWHRCFGTPTDSRRRVEVGAIHQLNAEGRSHDADRVNTTLILIEFPRLPVFDLVTDSQGRRTLREDDRARPPDRRRTRLTLPDPDEWQLGERGDSLLAVTEYRTANRRLGARYLSIDGSGRGTARLQSVVTELRSDDMAIELSQTLYTNGLYSEYRSWRLPNPGSLF